MRSGNFTLVEKVLCCQKSSILNVAAAGSNGVELVVQELGQLRKLGGDGGGVI